jgi:hypothetical protein
MVADSRIPEEQAVRVEDLVPLRSRVSWPAIFAGSVMALATFFVLMLLGAAVGLSVYDNVSGTNLNTGAAVWAVMATILALFVGGWVVSQATVGENKCEAAIHGVIMWGVTFALILTMAGMGVRAGFGAMVGTATIADRTGAIQANANQPGARAEVNQQELERNLREANFTDEQIAKVRDTINNPGANIREAVNNPENRERVATASWWTLFGVLLSMASAIGGALVGAGPTFRLLATGTYARTTVRREAVHS